MRLIATYHVDGLEEIVSEDRLNEADIEGDN